MATKPISQLVSSAEPPVSEHVSPAKAARRLDVSVDTLERHIRPALLTGEIVSYKIGARRIISWQSLLDYLKRYHNGALS